MSNSPPYLLGSPESLPARYDPKTPVFGPETPVSGPEMEVDEVECQYETPWPPPAGEPPTGAVLFKSTFVYQIFGSNTDVGKTVFSTILSKCTSEVFCDATAYLKPVTAGDVSDQDHVILHAPDVFSTNTLYNFTDTVSPHIAAQMSGAEVPEDQTIVDRVQKEIKAFNIEGNLEPKTFFGKWMFIETAGGVLTPLPSGKTQADVYSKLRLPVVLIGDSKLGGISQTISAYESLRLRGYDIALVLLFESPGMNNNHAFLKDYFSMDGPIEVRCVPAPPPFLGVGDEEQSDDDQMQGDGEQDRYSTNFKAMSAYYQEVSSSLVVSEVIEFLGYRHLDRLERLSMMAGIARNIIWWPYTQHRQIRDDRDITVIDSAKGDYFQTLRIQEDDQMGLLQSSFDGSASWWTQGFEHGNPSYGLTAAYAQGRYGHVIFPKAIHEPALSLAEKMLATLKNPRLARVFFSDNGSTGVEVAIKMALRSTRKRYGWTLDQKLHILGLEGGYHGDTLGAMNCAGSNRFNTTAEWFDPGKGIWMVFPSIVCTEGMWKIILPHEFEQFSAPFQHPNEMEFSYLFEVFDLDHRLQTSNLEKLYVLFITGELVRFREAGIRFGGLILEPVVQGAAGMVMVDPLFQRVLVDLVRRDWTHFPMQDARFIWPEAYVPSSEEAWCGLPVIFDEVFTGMFRLGRFTPASFLGVFPDISIHAKLLTGGTMPLCLTMASDIIFEAFRGPEDTDALLHGHSYTAYPAACQVAIQSIGDMLSMDENDYWNWYKLENGWNDIDADDPASSDLVLQSQGSDVWSFWSAKFVNDLSHRLDKNIAGVWALGTVLAIDFEGPRDMAKWCQKYLAQGWLMDVENGISSGWNVHTRVLGNVFYIIASLGTGTKEIKRMQAMLERMIGDYTDNRASCESLLESIEQPEY